MPTSAVAAIFRMKCPRCRTGDLFPTGAFSFHLPFTMHDRCPHCGQTYMPEPGFYYGAMFLSYIMVGFFSLGLTLSLVFAADWSVEGAFALLLAILAIFYVWIFRMARTLWIHIVVRYDPRQAEASESKTK